MLSISGVHTFYGHIEALKGVDIEVSEGEIVTIIGANGAGKSTLLMTICGTPQARHGSIVFEGEDITRKPTFEIMRRGIAQSPEGRRIFPRMSVKRTSTYLTSFSLIWARMSAAEGIFSIPLVILG